MKGRFADLFGVAKLQLYQVSGVAKLQLYQVTHIFSDLEMDFGLLLMDSRLKFILLSCAYLSIFSVVRCVNKSNQKLVAKSQNRSISGDLSVDLSIYL